MKEADLYKRAKAVHKRSFIIDSHCDTPMKFTDDFDLGKRTSFTKIDLPKMQEGMVDAVFMVAYLKQEDRNETASRLPPKRQSTFFTKLRNRWSGTPTGSA